MMVVHIAGVEGKPSQPNNSIKFNSHPAIMNLLVKFGTKYKILKAANYGTPL